MQDFKDLILEKEEDRVTFSCAFCSREKTARRKTFEKRPLCSSCNLRTLDHDDIVDSVAFLKKEFRNAKRVFSGRGLVLLETKQTFRASKKSLCECVCLKKHKVLLEDLERDGYEPCPSKRTRKGQNSAKEDKVRALFESRGCEFVGPYENNKTLTKYVCSCGKEGEVRVHAIKETWRGCRECSYKARAKALRK